MIYGVGIDIVQISRIEKALQRWGERFRNKVFTSGEVSYCQKKRKAAANYAARFAAKEAFVKALGVGMRRGIHWREIEVARGPLGKPILKVSGRAQEICQKEGIKAILVSLTHDQDYSSALVVLEKE